MKRFFSSLLALTLLFSMASATDTQWQTLDKQAKNTNTNVKLVNDNPNHLRLEFDFNAYSIKKVKTPKGIAQIINIPNCTRTKVKGAPNLPKISQALAIPNNAKMDVKVIKSRFIELDNILMAPSKGIMSRDKKTTEYPYVFGSVYTKNAFYPSINADINEPYIIRNVRGQTVVINPVQYNPITKKVRIYTSIVVDVVATGVDSKNAYTPNTAVSNDAVFNNVLTNHFINYNSTSEKYSPISEDGKKMLIVTYDSFSDEMEAFKSWKESIGYTVSIVDYSTIGSSAALKTYVQNQYDQNGISYLLLVGDHAQVPSSSTSAGDSDNDYGYTSGNDHYLDIFVGRFSGTNSTDIQTQIDRTIYYERDVSPTASWFNEGIGIASNEGTGGGGDDNESDEQHMNNIETDLEGYGYTINRCYQDGGSTAQLSNLINAGAGLINYVGHGSDYSWAAPSFTTANVNALSNENNLPFVISVACVVGNFTNITCYAETWLRATNNGNPTGAVVFCGSTINQSWSSPMSAQDEMNDLLVANSYITYGGMFVNGMFQMIDEYGADGENMADTWTVFGDPSVQMRTPGNPEGPEGGIVEEAPVADFSASATTIEEGETVTFTSNSTNNPTGLSWSFAGGSPSTSTAPSPTVTYSTAGTYQVSLTATNPYGNDTETKNAYITVQDNVPTYCTSKGSDASYEWIAGVEIGEFTNTTGTNGGYADFTGQTAELTAGQTYNLTLTPGFGSSAYNEYWKIWIDYNNDYDFDDANELVYDAGAMSQAVVTGTISIPADASGTRRMRVSMKYNGAQTACETFDYGEVEDYHVVFSNPIEAPVAEFAANTTTITEGESISFTDQSLNEPTSWSWSFQGGTPSSATAQNPTITYNTPGTYQVSLTATNAGGSDAETKTAYITVNEEVIPAPVANFNANSTTITVGQSVSFNDISTNTPTSWSWTFEGGTPATSSAQNPTITYNTAGTYQVSLTATNAGGNDTETKEAYITVTEESTGYCASSGQNVNYEWLAGVQIGDFTNNTGANGGYADFTGQVLELADGTSVDVTLTPGFQSNAYAEYYKIWIDYNNDGDFEDAGEEVFAKNASGAVSGSFTIASNVSVITRMRITMKYNAAPTPCESFSYGEVEDYTVSISGISAPVANFSANATTITAGESVSFTDQSTNEPTAWAWSFDGATPSTSTAQNPTVTYNTAGTYQVSLTISNAAGSDTETKYSYITVEAGDVTYCASNGNNSSYEWIEKVVIGGFTNTSGDNSGYQDFTNQMVNLVPGASTNITLTPGFSGSTYQEYWKIWIDYNKDGDFSDNGELVASGNGAGVISESMNVNASASGTTVMRVTMKYNAAPTSCETFDYGEVEDYTVSFSSKVLTGVVDAAEATVSIYPQPADELIHIEMTDAGKAADIKLYNMNGQLVNTANVNNNGNGFDYDVSSLPAGVYMMQVVTNDSIISERVVIK